jgi:hypothetical protein
MTAQGSLRCIPPAALPCRRGFSRFGGRGGWIRYITPPRSRGGPGPGTLTVCCWLRFFRYNLRDPCQCGPGRLAWACRGVFYPRQHPLDTECLPRCFSWATTWLRCSVAATPPAGHCRALQSLPAMPVTTATTSTCPEGSAQPRQGNPPARTRPAGSLPYWPCPATPLAALTTSVNPLFRFVRRSPLLDGHDTGPRRRSLAALRQGLYSDQGEASGAAGGGVAASR